MPFQYIRLLRFSLHYTVAGEAKINLQKKSLSSDFGPPSIVFALNFVCKFRECNIFFSISKRGIELDHGEGKFTDTVVCGFRGSNGAKQDVVFSVSASGLILCK